MKTLVVFVLSFVISACGTLALIDRHELEASIVVAEIVHGNPDRAEAMIESIDEMLERLEGNPRIPVSELYDRGEAHILAMGLRPAAREFGLSFLRRYHERLVAQVGEGEVPEGAIRQLRSILENAREAAKRELRAS